MANRKQQRARAERLHTRTEINRRLWRATRVAQIMYVNMLHEHAHALSDRYCAAVFSYLADDLAELQDLINQQHHH
ncbi:derepression protein [Escherichia coli]